MLPVAQKLFSRSGDRSGVASTHRVPPLRTMVPFVLPAQISLTQPTRCGRGMLVPVTAAAANTTVVVTHNLGRFAQCAWAVSNGGGNFIPKIKFTTDLAAVHTRQQQSIKADEVMQSCLVLFF